MPDQKTPGTDVVPPHWIVPGISFPNPRLTKTATRARRIPWMMPKNWQPLSVLSSGYPHVASGGMTGDPGLPIRKGYWRRKWKNNRLVRMGHNHKELASWDEIGLGESVNMTSAPAPTSERGFWGNMTSVLTVAGSIWQKNEAAKIQEKAVAERMKIQARADAAEPSSMPSPTTLAMIAGAGILGYFALSRR